MSVDPSQVRLDWLQVTAAAVTPVGTDGDVLSTGTVVEVVDVVVDNVVVVGIVVVVVDVVVVVGGLVVDVVDVVVVEVEQAEVIALAQLL